MNKIQIAGRSIGPGEPLFIVVETGTTCNGDLQTALGMVDAAKDAGADAIKFMIIGPDDFMSDTSVTYEYEWAGGKKSENMYEMFKKLTFTREDWKRIRDYCHKRNLIFYATVDFLRGVDLAEQLEVPAYKLSSWDTANLPLIRRMAATGKPVLVDTGPTTIIDLEELLEAMREKGNDQVIFIHCSHALNDEGINVRSLPYMRQVFGMPVGYSADSRDFVPDIMAVSLGANVIEKRLSLDRKFPGHHHVKAVEPHELKDWIAMMRRTEALLGDECIKPSPEDLRQRKLYFVSVVAEIDIPRGTCITREMLACKRPGHGIAPKHLNLLVGRRAQRDIKRNELLAWDSL